MSRVIPSIRGDARPRYWTYPAAVMMRFLEAAIRKRRIEPTNLPQGVYGDIKRFFGLVMQQVAATESDTFPKDDPAVTLRLYALSMRLCSGEFFVNLTTFEEWHARFARSARFLERLSVSGPLSKEELQTVRELQQFFDRLRRRGETERYERRMGCPPYDEDDD